MLSMRFLATLGASAGAGLVVGVLAIVKRLFVVPVLPFGMELRVKISQEL